MAPAPPGRRALDADPAKRVGRCDSAPRSSVSPFCRALRAASASTSAATRPSSSLQEAVILLASAACRDAGERGVSEQKIGKCIRGAPDRRSSGDRPRRRKLASSNVPDRGANSVSVI